MVSTVENELETIQIRDDKRWMWRRKELSI
jgi:hypothetical protein